MSTLQINGSEVGNALQSILMAPDITPGESVSYELCKILLSWHPLGQKLTETPITIAQSLPRKITVPKGPEERLVEVFNQEWEKLGADEHIHNFGKLARTYGVSTIALLNAETAQNVAVDYDSIWNAEIAFNVFDPLNTAGSLVLNQQPNAMDFQKIAGKGVQVQGQNYHPSRTVTLMHEKPIYIEYTTSAFGYVGRSVFQRPLYPLKSYILSMITDDMVALKAGVLIAKQKQPGSPMDAIMGAIAGQKRNMVKEAKTFNVISIGTEEEIAAIDLTNVAQSMTAARKNIIDNIATAADMPAIIINQETFAAGFGEGTEDARRVVQFVNGIRVWLRPAYAFFDEICMRRAWNPEFYKLIQKEYPEEYGAMKYEVALFTWKNSFAAVWPSLIEEPPSETVKVADVKFKAAIAVVEVLAPLLDPDNKARLVQWVADNFNENKDLFTSPLILDYEALAAYVPPVMAAGGEDDGDQPVKPAPPFSGRDSALSKYDRAVGELISLAAERKQLQRRRDHDA
jgi:hypothetical protein